MRINKKLNLIRDERGSVTMVIAGVTLALVIVAALAIDTGHLYAEQARLQASADAAVLAAANVLTKGGDELEAKNAALDFAQKNMPTGQYGTVLTVGDVVQGEYDSATKIFSPGGSTLNAVRVTLRRTSASGNPARAFFASVFKPTDVDIVVQSVAALGAAGCGGGTMYMAGNLVTMGQNMSMGAGTCVYARNGITAGQDPVVEEGAFIGALDIDTITFGQNPSIPDGAIGEVDLEPAMANNVDQIISDLQNGVNLPPQITSVEVLGSLPGSLDAGTAYVITNNVSLNQDYTLTDVIIASTGSIIFGQDGRIRNSAGTCGGGETAIGLYAANNISIGQDAVIEGAQVVAGNDVAIGQNLGTLAATIEAGNNLSIGQDPQMSSCAGAMSIPGGGTGGTASTARLVL